MASSDVTGSGEDPPVAQERMAEWTIQSRKAYADPFNDVDLDVIFSKDGKTWRVPTFWRGGQKWTVRFAPGEPGEYTYHLESTDPSNPDLNGREGKVTVTAYSGSNTLLQSGALRVSANKRYFEHADGTPFYWLGDTWWPGLSTRISWEAFRKLAADRKEKGFTVIQIVAGLVPDEERHTLEMPGVRNEGGPVWEADFKQINPAYFDHADRRIQHLIDQGITPAIVGGWFYWLPEIGVAKMKQHWRYIIARYGAYPAFWIVGGEVLDPPIDQTDRIHDSWKWLIVRGWTDVARYIRATDPYRHPMTVHEFSEPASYPVQDHTLTDFDLPHTGHKGWAGAAMGVAGVNLRYARDRVIKPIVQGEIGYEGIFATHYEDFQRAAFWLTMLNGAAGHTYGADGLYSGSNTRYSLMNWEDGMNLPGSYQLGLGSKLLRQFSWWRFTPRPEWVAPRGTTLLEPNDQINGFPVGTWDVLRRGGQTTLPYTFGNTLTGDAWNARNGNFFEAYAAGIPREIRVIYAPYNGGIQKRPPPTVLGLEPGVRYNAYYWDPSLGVRVDLGSVERPAHAPILFGDSLKKPVGGAWLVSAGSAQGGTGGLTAAGDFLAILKAFNKANAVSSVDARSDANATLLLRYMDADNYISAVYSPEEKAMYVRQRFNGVDGEPLGLTPVAAIGGAIRMSAEVRDDHAIVSVSDGEHNYTTPIVDVDVTAPGGFGLMHRAGEIAQIFANFELRDSVVLPEELVPVSKLYDAKGQYRGELDSEFGRKILLKGIGNLKPSGVQETTHVRKQSLLLDAYRPSFFPFKRDMVLVLDANGERPG